MDREAEQVPPGADGLLYLPYLMGERTPHLDPDCRGVFFGISARHGKKEFLRAVMEGVGYSLMDCMDILREMGVEAREIRASGGGGRSPLWRAMQADMFGASIVTLGSSEGPALGAAILGAVAGGVYGDVRSACDAIVSVRSRQDPDPVAGAVYARRHKLYRSLYSSLKDDFKRLAESG